MSLEIYCDFDGTITQKCTVDYLLATLADPSWREIEARWERGEIGSRECMGEQVALIRGGWAAMEEALDKVKFDPTFAEFAFWCKGQRIPLKVVSDGIDRVIHFLLRREGIHVDQVIANKLVETPDGRLKLEFPYGSPSGHCTSGVCKSQILWNNPYGPHFGRTAKTTKVVVGDGQSDVCWAPEADCLFAKAKLLKHCKANNVPYIAYDNFRAIRAVLEEQYVPVSLPVYQPIFEAIPALQM